MPLPRISVVTPSFNQARFVERTMRSVLDQDYPKGQLEYLVLDGGSTDGSAEIISASASRLAYFRSEKDEGQAAAIKEGFDRSTGDVLCWINSDDLLEPSALRRVGQLFDARPDVDLIHGGLRSIDVDDRRLYTSWAVLSLGILAYENPFIPQQAMFWRRKIYEKAGGVDPAYHFAMDFDLVVRMLLAGARPLKISPVLGSIRWHPDAKGARLQALCATEVARTLERHRLVKGSHAARTVKKYAYRLYRLTRDPRNLLGAVESRLRGYGPNIVSTYPSSGPTGLRS